MKKIVITLLTACFLVSTGFAEESSKEEIKFRNIEWGCSVDEMYEQFPEISLTDTGKGSYMPYWERFEPGNGKDTTKFATAISQNCSVRKRRFTNDFCSSSSYCRNCTTTECRNSLISGFPRDLGSCDSFRDLNH